MRSTLRSRKDSTHAPIPSANRSHENRKVIDTPTTSVAIQSTPEPAKPSSFMLALPTV